MTSADSRSANNAPALESTPARIGEPFVCEGMPPLDTSGRTLSFFEFWPPWRMYLPVVCQWLLLGIWHRSFTLPLIANPKLVLSGILGVPKSQLLLQAKGKCDSAILPWFLYEVTDQPVSLQADAIAADMDNRQLVFPVVCKPDIGCRGMGVKLVDDKRKLQLYIAAYPVGTGIMVQKPASYEPEAGVFFVKEPVEANGRVTSLTLKYSPYVVGNGQDTLAQLIADDERAGQLLHLYLDRHKNHLESVIPDGEPFRLVFSTNHTSGAIFKNGQQYITAELNRSVNEIFRDLPEFYFGRMDVKFPTLEDLRAGKNLEIIEINPVGSEPTHIYDSNIPFSEAIRSLLFHYRILFKLGSQNRKRGYKPPGLGLVFKHWRISERIKKFYPATD